MEALHSGAYNTSIPLSSSNAARSVGRGPHGSLAVVTGPAKRGVGGRAPSGGKLAPRPLETSGEPRGRAPIQGAARAATPTITFPDFFFFWGGVEGYKRRGRRPHPDQPAAGRDPPPPPRAHSPAIT